MHKTVNIMNIERYMHGYAPVVESAGKLSASLDNHANDRKNRGENPAQTGEIRCFLWALAL